MQHLQRIAGSVITSTVLSLIIYFLLQILVVDLAEEIVQGTLQSPSTNVAISMNFITWIYMLNIFFASYTATSLFFKRKAIIPAFLATVASIALIYFVGYVTFTLAYPHVELNITGFLSLPTLFLTYVIKDITNYVLIILAMQQVFFIEYSQILNKGTKYA